MKCMSCYEEINESAKKCPHCRQIQSKLHTLFVEPKYQVLFVILFLCFFGWLFLQAKNASSLTKPDLYAPELTNEKLITFDSNSGPFVTCFGNISNTNSKNMRAISLQAKFYNSENKSIDVENHKLETILNQKSNMDFKIRTHASTNLQEYVTCKISVLNY